MTQITLKVEGSDVLVSKFKEATLAIENLPKKEIKEEMTAALEAARTYPDELPNQGYVRTFTYYRSFKLTPAGKGYTLSSNAQQKGRYYTRYVGGMADGSGQARIHIGRWPRIKYEVSAAVERIRLRAEQKFRDILGSGPGGL